MKWAILALAAIGVGVSFFVRCDDEAAETKGGGGPRVAAVATARVGGDAVVERVAYPGELDADVADIAAVFSGRLDAVQVRIGDRVALGDVLAVVSIVDLAEQKAEAEAQVRAARAAIQASKAELELARREASRFAKLVEGSLVSTSEADAATGRARALAGTNQGAQAALAQAQARLALLVRRESESTVRAPFAGRVVDRYADPGGFVAVGARLVRVVADDALRVRFEVPEQDIAYAAVGGVVDVVVPALGEASAKAKVTGIGGEVLRDRRVVMVEGLVAERPATWVAGMYASVLVVRHSIDDGPVVPEAALLARVDEAGVGVGGIFVREGTTARWVPVTVRARSSGRVAVQGTSGAGVAIGAEVLVEGHQDLADGAAIRVSRQAPEHEAQP